MYSLGINVCSSSVKVFLMEDGKILWQKVVAHEGNFLDTLKNSLSERTFPEETLCLATGTEGRHLLNMNNVLESLCIEQALNALNYNVDAVVSLGGENFVVYTIDKEGKIITNFSGNKCASGTGEFFKQQLGRMDLTLSDVQSLPEASKVHPMASRCSVFMKSDCTHKLNKGEATKGDIALSLSNVMATKVIDFLKRARITQGKVLLSRSYTKQVYRAVPQGKTSRHRIYSPGRGSLLRGLRSSPSGPHRGKPASFSGKALQAQRDRFFAPAQPEDCRRTCHIPGAPARKDEGRKRVYTGRGRRLYYDKGGPHRY